MLCSSGTYVCGADPWIQYRVRRTLPLSTELVWWVVLRFRPTKLRLVAVKLHQTTNIDINSPRTIASPPFNVFILFES